FTKDSAGILKDSIDFTFARRARTTEGTTKHTTTKGVIARKPNRKFVSFVIQTVQICAGREDFRIVGSQVPSWIRIAPTPLHPGYKPPSPRIQSRKAGKQEARKR